MNNDFESTILNFLDALKARQTREAMAVLAPVVDEVTKLAQSISHLHRHSTSAGAAFADLHKALVQKGVSEEVAEEMLDHVRAAQNAFADDIAQAALEAAIQHYNDALEIAEKLVKK